MSKLENRTTKNTGLKAGEEQAESATLILAFLPSFGWLVPIHSLYNGSIQSDTYLDLFPKEGYVIWFVLIFFFLHHLRMSLGFAFIAQDDSFREAINKIYNSSKSEIISISKAEVIIRFTMTFLLFLTLVIFKYNYVIAINIVIFLQLFIMATYNRIFWWALYNEDADKQNNTLILIGDICFFALFICGLGLSLNFWTGNSLFFKHLIMVLFWIFCLVFSFELGFHYLSAVKKQINELINGYLNLMERIKAPSPNKVCQEQHNKANQADG